MTRILGWLACATSVVLLVVAMVTGVAPASAATAPARITGAWVHLAAVPGRPAAGYFTLAATAPATLTGVTSPVARIELHDATMVGGVMHMDALRSLPVAAGQTLRFAPGGRHLMLFDLIASVRPGTTVPLTFAFADGSTVRVDAAVRGPGSDAMPGMPM